MRNCLFFIFFQLLKNCLSFFSSINFLSQNNITISGYVDEAESGEKLIGATIYDLKSGKGTITNDYGFFSLTLPKIR